MSIELGEARERLGMDVLALVEDFVVNMKDEREPFYVVYACKEDRGMSQKLGTPAFKQAIRAYKERPPEILGILVWYVDNSRGEVRFVPELSAPYDIPLDPELLSDKASDACGSIMEKGKKLNVILS